MKKSKIILLVMLFSSINHKSCINGRSRKEEKNNLFELTGTGIFAGSIVYLVGKYIHENFLKKELTLKQKLNKLCLVHENGKVFYENINEMIVFINQKVYPNIDLEGNLNKNLINLILQSAISLLEATKERGQNKPIRWNEQIEKFKEKFFPVKKIIEQFEDGALSKYLNGLIYSVVETKKVKLTDNILTNQRGFFAKNPNIKTITCSSDWEGNPEIIFQLFGQSYEKNMIALLGDYSSARFTTNYEENSDNESLADVFSIISIIFTYTKAAMEIFEENPRVLLLRGNHESEDQISAYPNMNLVIEKFGLKYDYNKKIFQEASNILFPFIAAFKFTNKNLLLSHSLYADKLLNNISLWEQINETASLKKCILKNNPYYDSKDKLYSPLTCWSTHYLRRVGEDNLVINEKQHNEYINNLFNNNKITYNIVGHNNGGTYSLLSEKKTLSEMIFIDFSVKNQNQDNKSFDNDFKNLFDQEPIIQNELNEYTLSELDEYQNKKTINLMVPSALPFLWEPPFYFNNPTGYKISLENNNIKNIESVKLKPLMSISKN
jgi:hypothetical protein